MTRSISVALLSLASLLPACAPLNAADEPPAFKTAPAVARRGKAFAVTFSVTAPTDVAVSIRKNNRVVRHLAAGRLGDAPPKPLTPGLTQSLTWDGNDDLGRKVDPAGCSVHVGLTLTPRFDRVLAWKGEALAGCISGLHVDPRGRLYVLNSPFKGPTRVVLLDRSGRYLRTVVPFSAALPLEKVRPVGFLDFSPTDRVPIIRNPIFFAFYPELFGNATGYGLPHQTMARVGDQLVMTNAWFCNYACNVGRRRLLIVKTDGSLPENYLGPLLGKGRQPGFVHLAPVPGQNAVFATGLTTTGEWKTAKPFHAVYKVALDSPGPPPVYLGRPETPGSGATGLNDPRGLAVDPHGNLYVADWANNRVAVFKPDRSLLGEVAVKQPGPICLHHTTNALYVMTVAARRFPNGGLKILKLPPAVTPDGKWAGSGPPLAELKLRYGEQIFAVDGTAKPTVLWIGSRFQTPALLRVVEKDGKFSKPTPILPADDPAYHLGGFLAVDRRRDVVYVRRLRKPGGNGGRLVRIDGLSGKTTLMKLAADDLAVDRDGNLLTVVSAKDYVSRIVRLDPAGKPLPFAATGTNVLVEGSFLKKTFFASQHCPRGLAVSPTGDIHVLYPSHELGKKQRYLFCTVDVFASDGKRKRHQVLWASNAAGGVCADAAGNIYVSENLKPKGQPVPPELAGKVPAGRRWTRGFNWYPWLYGSVVKFPPQGGAAKVPMAWAGYYGWKPLPEWKTPTAPPPKPVECTWDYGRKAHVQNAARLYPGISPAPSPLGGCVCFSPRFDLDGFGRLFLPDIARFSVRVLDNAGNLIRRIGRYGNPDDTGRGEYVPLAWPQYVALSDAALYISDPHNRRLLRVDLTYAAEKTVPLP